MHAKTFPTEHHIQLQYQALIAPFKKRTASENRKRILCRFPVRSATLTLLPSSITWVTINSYIPFNQERTKLNYNSFFQVSCQ
jgi:hypothetical protein